MVYRIKMSKQKEEDMENIGFFLFCLGGSIVVPLLIFLPLIITERNKPPYSNVRRLSSEGCHRTLIRAEKNDRRYEEEYGRGD